MEAKICPSNFLKVDPILMIIALFRSIQKYTKNKSSGFQEVRFVAIGIERIKKKKIIDCLESNSKMV